MNYQEYLKNVQIYGVPAPEAAHAYGCMYDQFWITGLDKFIVGDGYLERWLQEIGSRYYNWYIVYAEGPNFHYYAHELHAQHIDATKMEQPEVTYIHGIPCSFRATIDLNLRKTAGLILTKYDLRGILGSELYSEYCCSGSFSEDVWKNTVAKFKPLAWDSFFHNLGAGITIAATEDAKKAERNLKTLGDEIMRALDSDKCKEDTDGSN